MFRTLQILPFFLLMTSCLKDPNPVFPDSDNPFLSGSGIMLLNEGNFRAGNGSLSFFSYDSLKVFNEAFLDVNGRPLGDIPYSIAINNGKCYIVVNNSNKIEVINSNDLKSIATITGTVSPRYISFINNSEAYVTSLYSDSITIVDLSTNSVSGYINLDKTSEYIVAINSTVYAANWAGGKEVFVIDTGSDRVTGVIEVGSEPESMVIDRNKTLWVLCNGGWKREYFAELVAINTKTNAIIKRFPFPSINDSPTCLQIDSEGEHLFYIHNGIRRMGINDAGLPASVFIESQDHTFYKLFLNPENDEIFVTDAVDYSRKGYLLRYSSKGNYITSMLTGIIPGGMCSRPDPEFEKN